MKEENLLRVGHAGLLELTEEGKLIAEYTFQKHSLLKKMLCDIGVEEQQADIEAYQIEHIISDETFQRLTVVEKEFASSEFSPSFDWRTDSLSWHCSDIVRDYLKVCVNLQTGVRYNYSVWRFLLWQEKMKVHKKQQ